MGVDSEGVKAGVKAMVDAYNAVIDFIDDQNELSGEEGELGGPLFGDSIFQTVQSTLSGALFNVDVATVQADTEGFSTLGLIGLDLGVDGKITIDDETFDAKLQDDSNLFMELFADSDGFDNGSVSQSDPAYFTDTTADTGLAVVSVK